MSDFRETISFIQSLYPSQEVIPLHAPVFNGNERKYVLDTIDSTFVSSVGEYVNRFESMMASYTGARFAVATMNGTSALHLALILAGVKPGDLVITQSLTFIATCNAINYTGAEPAFVDVSLKTLGMDSSSLKQFLNQVELKDGQPIHIPTGKKIGACLPMHTLGFPVELDEISELCADFNMPLIEDAAESIGSFYKGKHTGTIGKIGTFSFNGNKTITCGGGGIVVTDDEEIATLGKHLSTQAKVPHRWEYVHDHIGFNYRCPNLNAALACAQLEQLESIILNKRETASQYLKFFTTTDISFFTEPENCRSNYWLNAVLLSSREERDEFLKVTNDAGVMTRPVWSLIHNLPMFKDAYQMPLPNSKWIEDRLVNLPSSVR